MKKTLVVLLFCVLAGSLAFAKPKAKDYPLQFTVLAGVEATNGCYMNVTEGDGDIYEVFAPHSIFGRDCPTWSPGVKVNGKFHHWPGAETEIVFFYYVTQKNGQNKPATFWFHILNIVRQ
jgi:hypothetical protein